MPNTIDMTGARIGFLTVLRREGSALLSKGHEVAAWRCVCDCGREVVVTGVRLRRQSKKACNIDGHRYKFQLHDAAKNERQIYYAMLQRCYNHKSLAYKWYGYRGIRVCRRWRASFNNFLSDMGPRPSKDYSLERIDNDKGYSPENCRWATDKEQARNRRDNVRITFDGETLTISEFAERFGLTSHTVAKRLRRGWSIEAALTELPSDRRPFYPPEWIDGSAFKKS